MTFIFHPSSFILCINSPHSRGRDDTSTFLSPSITRWMTLPNSWTSFGADESAAIFCADLKYSADWIALAMNCCHWQLI
ncbi:MAG: hypothetical protein ACOYZ8_18550 [Chloroflexota bacterium]